ncbi:MAG TPA: glutathione S-transferase family protein, partial [Geminicoccaceae bacterium]|nr:glutathione S-transferase family protein [Geminicoccaceae bacterium]
MTRPYVVYGQKGTGSVPVEATLLLLGEPYELLQPAPSENPAAGDLDAEAMARVNPMQQVPALVLPNGELMTESAAILIHLADSHPSARLAPAPDDPRRPAFLRWMIFVAAQIYGQVWARDDPARLAADEAHKAVIRERTAERMAYCWRVMDGQVNPGRYILGDDLSVLDLYVTVVSHWGPRRPRFYQEAPKMA